MSKTKWWLLMFFSGAFISGGLENLLRFQSVTWIPIIAILVGAYGLYIAIHQRKEPLSRLEWVVLVWFALAAAVNATRPLIGPN